MTPFYDALETEAPEQREARLFKALAELIGHAKNASAGWAGVLEGVEPADVSDRHALAQLPVVRKTQLLQWQQQARRQGGDALGGFATVARGPALARVFASPGPIYEPQGRNTDHWRMARSLFAAGFRAGDLVHNALSYHMTPGAFMMDGGAAQLGCTVFPAGVGQTELQLQAIADLQPNGYIGTPSHLRLLVERANDAQVDIGSLGKAMVGGEPFPADLRAWLATRGVDAYQCYATAEAGLIAYETGPREGMVADEHVLIEIVDPDTRQPVPDGQVGELVVSVLNPVYPLIRLGTGDLSAIMSGACPSGRTNVRIQGWMGRADQATKVRGLFIRPEQIRDVLSRFPEVSRASLVITGEIGKDRMVLQVLPHAHTDGLDTRLAAAVREFTKLRCEVEIVGAAQLATDGKLIDDRRKVH
ncbi:phenylacetate--CoA ligase family protein [Castellaniella sp.]|uniref:phenylacetate--CoA ligase family protein n=1 Tax=Castellaniella sp. TaxID=1955812 RepID=UPI0035682100